MATYQAILMHGGREAEATREFDGPDDLMAGSPAAVMRTYMEWVDAHAGVGHVDYELNAAMKSKDGRVVTTLGSLIFHGNDHQPFVCMISKG
ncbi:hypothetical protein RGUI_3106 [Rhodovulum sp. P5]|uniref:hypothetical protein n=1 Tax=Rhodovulum sp. P5 TaxID=1564506 RepID=UPI0009C2B999|nr:hypothetical protein [Rhodovulum sp. P5]ARE41247.1 hypothetical protein RGUI_3106 [Rhodovulum sp. P5]